MLTPEAMMRAMTTQGIDYRERAAYLILCLLADPDTFKLRIALRDLGTYIGCKTEQPARRAVRKLEAAGLLMSKQVGKGPSEYVILLPDDVDRAA